MAKYIFQLRRGTIQEWADYEATKYIESQRYVATTTYYLNQQGTIADPQPTQDDVKNGHYYIKNPEYLPPQDGEMVIVYDKGVPRIKIGNNNQDCSQLPYMGIDSFILPMYSTITLYGGNNWIAVPGYTNRYTQDITSQLAGKITENSKVDLQPTPEQLYIFQEKDVTFTTVNEDGVVRVCAIGVRPEQNYEVQVTITEVMIDG